MYILNKRPFYSAVSPIGRTRRSENQEVEAGVLSLSFTSNDPLCKFVLPIPETLGSEQLRVLLFPEREYFHHGCQLGSLSSTCQWSRARRGITILAEVIGPGHREEVRLWLHNRENKICFPHRWFVRAPLGTHLYNFDSKETSVAATAWGQHSEQGLRSLKVKSLSLCHITR